jgi:hypothetical protein
MNIFRRFGLAVVVVAALVVWPAAGALAGSSGQVPLAGTGSAQTGDFTPSGTGDVTQAEFPTDDDAPGPNPYNGTISFSTGAGSGPSVSSGKKAKSNPTFNFGFEGLNHYQQRYSRGGNQFSLEPPDQGLCVGNGDVVEVVNDVFNVYSAATGASLLPDNTASNIVSGFPRNVNHAVDLNSFYGYPPAINRSTGVRGPEVTDPSCIFDTQTQRFFVLSLTLDSQVPGPCQGVFSCVNHLDLAVSQTSDPTGSWNIYRIDVTNDGTNTGGANPGPYLGDYPHIGADANGIYLTTNAYPWHENGFAGAQIYALSKAQLAAGASSVTIQHVDTSGMVNAPSEAGSTQPGFTLWPAQSPGASQFNAANNGTEYFLSSNAADEAQHPVTGTPGTRTSNQLIVWSLTNTASLNTASPAVSLSNKILTVGQYGVPPKQQQPGSGTAPATDDPAVHRPERLLEAARRRHRPRGRARGCLEPRLQRHADAAGDVRQRQALGRAGHGAEPQWRAAAGRHRVVHREPGHAQGGPLGLPRSQRPRLHLPGDRRHRQRPRRDGLHRHR